MSPLPLHVMFAPSTVDDERRAPMGLAERDTCHRCRGPVSRTDATGLCWSCMPTH